MLRETITTEHDLLSNAAMQAETFYGQLIKVPSFKQLIFRIDARNIDEETALVEVENILEDEDQDFIEYIKAIVRVKLNPRMDNPAFQDLITASSSGKTNPYFLNIFRLKQKK